MSTSATTHAIDDRYMAEALADARRGLGRTHPNPAVGAVIVRDGEIVGRGFHRKVGLPHAEVEAIAQAGDKTLGATLYVNLEPCKHHGRTPPCTEAIVKSGIRRVVMGCVDPNPMVNGAGAAALRAAGIEVVEGVMEAECRAINKPFFHFIATGKPYIVLKAATTLDGKIAAARGDSRWVSGEAARNLVHVWRDEMDAVIVGAGTVRTDDPMLTTRLVALDKNGREPRNAVRVVVAGMAAIPMNSQILDASAGQVLIAVAESKSAAYRHLTNKGAEILPIAGAEDRVSIPALVTALGERGITSVMVEGGAGIYAAFLKAGCVDELRLFLAPRIVGGEGLSLLGPLGIDTMDGAWRVEVERLEHVGEDVLIVAKPKAR